MRAIFRLGKLNRLRFVSHLDLQRYMQRALSRAELPVFYSQGFNPHPVMSFASALAMGWESEYEVLDIKLAKPISAESAKRMLASALPAEMPVYDCRIINDSHPAMMALVKYADYIITPETDFEALKQGAREFLVSESVSAIRKTKSGEREIDIRPLCASLNTDATSFKATLMLTETDTLKPDLLMNAIAKLAEIEMPNVRIFRKRLLGVNTSGKTTPLMEL